MSAFGGDTLLRVVASVKLSKVLRGRQGGRDAPAHAIACGEVDRLDEAGGRVRRVARVGQSRNSGIGRSIRASQHYTPIDDDVSAGHII